MAKNLHIPKLLQRDNRWTNTILGYNTQAYENIGRFGCLLTCLTMAVNFFGKNENPITLNQKLKNVGGFVNGGSYVYNSIEKVFSDTDEGWVIISFDSIKSKIDNNQPVIVEVDFNPNTSSWDQHWVLVTGYQDNGELIINDPYHNHSKISQYKGGYRTSIYGANRVIKKAITLAQTATKPVVKQDENYKYFITKKGGWRSEIIKEIIEADLWSGTWQENEAKFISLNPTTPIGGWSAGNQIVIAKIETPTPPPSPEPPVVEIVVVDEIIEKEETDVVDNIVEEELKESEEPTTEEIVKKDKEDLHDIVDSIETKDDLAIFLQKAKSFDKNLRKFLKEKQETVTITKRVLSHFNFKEKTGKINIFRAFFVGLMAANIISQDQLLQINLMLSAFGASDILGSQENITMASEVLSLGLATGEAFFARISTIFVNIYHKIIRR